MISLVVVSHSRALAEAAVALASEMVPGPDGPRIEVAAGLDDGGLGTDAAAVAAALERAGEAAGEDGVLVLVDLGSAVLSAEMALDFVDPDLAGRVRLSAAPLVEGLVAAVVAAGAGSDVAAVAREAEAGLTPKAAHLGLVAEDDEGAPDRPDGAGPDQGDDDTWSHSVELSVLGEHGLHARPAARVVALAGARSPGTKLRLRNLTSGGPAADALSLSAVATLDARQGHVLLAEADGPDAEALLAELQDLAATGFGDLRPPVEPMGERVGVAPAVSDEPGVAGSGLEAAVGPVVRVEEALDLSGIEPAGVETEQQRWRDAVEEAVGRLGELQERARRHLGEGEAEVFEAHAALLRDPQITDDVARRVDDGEAAALAWAESVRAASDRFEALEDPYQRERAQDVRSIGERVLRILLGASEPERLERGVLVVEELDPALAISLDGQEVLGVLTRRGGATGHGVLIATARGVPVLTGVGDRADVPDGTVVAFDVRTGRLEVDPAPEVRAELEAVLEQRRTERERALEHARGPALTTDGVDIAVRANVASLAEARLAAEMGAAGSGLVRTEAVFGRWRTEPTVEQQVEVYTAIAEACAPHPVTIRTWDVGGDKPLLFIPGAVEANPFLGARGLRAFADDPRILLDQLEALCRVGTRHPVKVLFPMVTTLADVALARELLDQAARRAGLDGAPEQVQVGIMVEVPAAALRVGQLAAGLDFVSIGSNDLSQYTLAAERGNPALADWSDHLEPAVLRLVRDVCDAVPPGMTVSLCGSMAADASLAGLLVGLGVRDLSSSAAAVPLVKERLRGGSVADFRALADRALEAPDAPTVRALVG